MKTLFTQVSQNAKTGPMPVTITEKASCWTGCALYEKGCYAFYGALGHFWSGVSEGTRGGSWDDGLRRTRSAARVASSRDWKQQDPQVPQSIWYFTDALFLGFRIVRPLNEPSDDEKTVKWDKSEPPQIDKDKQR